MKLLVSILIFSRLAFATFGTNSQHVVQEGATVCGNMSTTQCSTGTISAIGAGHFLWAMISGGAPTAMTGGCAAWADTGNTATQRQWYCLSSTAGDTSVSGTVTSNGSRGIDFYEVPYTGASVAFEGTVGPTTDSSTNPCAGKSPMITGTNDIVFQTNAAGASSPTISSIDGGYTASIWTGNAARATAVLKNTTDTTAPNWGLSGNGSCSVTASSFKEIAAAGAPANQIPEVN